MATIARGTKAGGSTNFNSGQTIDPAEVNTDLNTIYTEFNGNVENANVKAAAAIVLTKLAHYGARVYNSANISILNATNTILTFDSERYDTDAIHSTASNTGRLTIPSGGTGKYLIVGMAEFASNATGYRNLFIRLNGATIIANHIWLPPTGASETAPSMITTIYSLVATDYVELMAYQSSGGALNILATSQFSPEFAIALLGA